MRRRLLVGLAVVVGVAAVAALGALGAARAALAPAEPGAGPVVYTVERGASLARVSRDLESRGIVRDARALEWLGRWRGVSARLRAGEFEVAASQSPGAILDTLVSGPVVTYEVVLPEGLRVEEIAARLAEAGLVDGASFVAYARDAASAEALGVGGPTLEGYLFPETYRLPRGLPVEEVARVLVEHFLAVWTELEAEAAARKLDMRQTVTLASIVEKETGAPEERPLIAGVFHNRLRRGIRLESDPTVIYGIANFDGNLKRVHLEDGSNPYNTYRIPGLPPGPIASPGADALRAVVRPAATEYLFFVSRNDGTHVFARTYPEHVNNVNRYQRRRKK